MGRASGLIAAAFVAVAAFFPLFQIVSVCDSIAAVVVDVVVVVAEII